MKAAYLREQLVALAIQMYLDSLRKILADTSLRDTYSPILIQQVIAKP